MADPASSSLPACVLGSGQVPGPTFKPALSADVTPAIIAPVRLRAAYTVVIAARPLRCIRASDCSRNDVWCQTPVHTRGSVLEVLPAQRSGTQIGRRVQYLMREPCAGAGRLSGAGSAARRAARWSLFFAA